MRRFTGMAIVLLFGAAFFARLSGAAAQPVDLALVMAVDVSESVDADEYVLQHEGIARAFEDPQLDALLAARKLLDEAPDAADRRLVDLSGDGIANIGPPVQDVRDELVAAGITINGLAILASEPWLESYYDEYVIGGIGAFLLRAEDFSSFATAMHGKLLSEISGLTSKPPILGKESRANRRLARLWLPVAQMQYVRSGAKPLKPTDE